MTPAVKDRPIQARPRGVRTDDRPNFGAWFYVDHYTIASARTAYGALRRHGIDPRTARNHVLVLVGSDPVR